MSVPRSIDKPYFLSKEIISHIYVVVFTFGSTQLGVDTYSWVARPFFYEILIFHSDKCAFSSKKRHTYQLGVA